jgi:hypothetical protein
MGRDATYDDLTARIHNVLSRELPPHITVRLVFVIGDAPVRFLDAHLKETPQGLTGTVVAFTDHLVFVVRFADQNPWNDPYGGEVTLSAVARRTLAQLAVLPTKEPDRSQYKVWTPEEGGLIRWPRRARVELTYPGVDPIVVPRGNNAENFDAFLSTLLDDLAGGPRATSGPDE